MAALMAASAPRAHASNYIWNAASGNWSAAASWTPAGGPPGAADTATFGITNTTSSSTTVNNIVDPGFSGRVANLIYNSAATTAAYNVTQIGSGQTLVVTNWMLVGGLNKAAGGYATYAYMTGGGTLMVTGTNLAVENYGTASGANATAYLNLSSLNNFVYSNSAGIISVADTTLPESSGSLNTRAGGNFVLAGVSNYITASTINLGTCNNAQAGPASTLVLGPGTNIINAANINIANNKNTFSVTFAASTGGLRIRGVSGADTDRAAVTVGNRNQTGTGTTSGSFVAVGNPLDIKASTLTVGANPNTGTTTGDTGTGVFQYDTGVVNATTVVIANTATASGTANGTLSVGATGTLLVGFGGISLATQTAGTAAGTLNIAAGGVVTNFGSITDGTAAGTGSLNLGGTLVMGLDTTIGTTNAPISNFTISNDVTLQLAPSSLTVPNVNVGNLTWPDTDSTLTIIIAGLPSGTTVGSAIPLFQFSGLNGTVTAPNLILPSGVTGSLAQNGSTIVLTITGGTIPSVPAVPTHLTGSLQGSSQVELSWTDSGATSYIILRSTNAAGPYSFIAEGVATTSYTDTGVVTGVPYYYYEVIGVNSAGASAASSSIAVPLGPTIPSMSPSYETLCTNAFFTATANSAAFTITNVQVIVTTTTLGGTASTTATNVPGSPGLTVTGLGTGTANISYALHSNTVYSSVVVKATDANGITVTSPADAFDTLAPVLVIEASDFNFNGGQFMDTPANGGLGLYAGSEVGNVGVDEAGAIRTAAKSYRPNDAVVIQPAAGQGTATTVIEQKFANAAAAGDTNYTDITEMEVGYNSPGQWENYTRTYGSDITNSAPAGTYNVWLYSATSGSGVQETLYEVTSDPTQGGQTSNYLGSFGTSNYANTSYNNYVYLPLVDKYGNIVTVTLSNTATLKPVVVGNPNIAFYMLTPPEPVTTPTLIYAYPDGSSLLQGTNELTFIVDANAGAAIATNGFNLVLNGVNVTSSLIFSDFGGTWTITCPIRINSLYSATLTVTNAASAGFSYSVNFDNFAATNYQWEAVDYDFTTNSTAGQFIDNAVPTGDGGAVAAGQFSNGTMATNSYFEFPEGLFNNSYAQQGIDVGWNMISGQVMDYRADGVATQPSTDAIRPKFIAAQKEFNDPAIGPFNICYFTNGSWLNYTRHYPTNNFYIWGRLAGTPAYTNTQMSILTSGYGTSMQTSNILGTFSDPNAAGFQAWHWIPLFGSNGSPVVVSLGQGQSGPGLETLQVTSGSPQYCNMEFFMLVPAPQPFNVTASISSGQLELRFPTEAGVSYSVLYKNSLTSPSWSQVGPAINGTGSPTNVMESYTGTQGYYIISAQ